MPSIFSDQALVETENFNIQHRWDDLNSWAIINHSRKQMISNVALNMRNLEVNFHHNHEIQGFDHMQMSGAVLIYIRISV
jgi:hypothetical protein